MTAKKPLNLNRTNNRTSKTKDLSILEILKVKKTVQEKHTYCASMLGIIYDDPALHFISQT